MNIIPIEYALTFLLGGRSGFVLWNRDTDNRFEYSVTLKETEDGSKIWWIRSAHHFIGTLYEWNGTIQFKKSKDINPNLIEYKAIVWYIGRLVNNPKSIPDNVVIYHLGKCGVCGRKLTDPESVVQGIGPVCRGMNVKIHPQ
jgi:hypothetical protein